MLNGEARNLIFVLGCYLISCLPYYSVVLLHLSICFAIHLLPYNKSKDYDG